MKFALSPLWVLLSLLACRIGAKNYNNGVTIKSTGGCRPSQLKEIYAKMLEYEEDGLWNDDDFKKLNTQLRIMKRPADEISLSSSTAAKNSKSCEVEVVSKTLMEAAAVWALHTNPTHGHATYSKEQNPDYLVPEATKDILLKPSGKTPDLITLQPSETDDKGTIQDAVAEIMKLHKDRFSAFFMQTDFIANKYLQNKIVRNFCRWWTGSQNTFCEKEMNRQIAFEVGHLNRGTRLLFRRAGRDDIQGEAAFNRQEERLRKTPIYYHECAIEDTFAKSFGYSLLAGAIGDRGACVIDFYGIQNPILTRLLVLPEVAEKTLLFVKAPYLLTLFGYGEFWHPRSKMNVSQRKSTIKANEAGFIHIEASLSTLPMDYFFTTEEETTAWDILKTAYETNCAKKRDIYRTKQGKPLDHEPAKDPEIKEEGVEKEEPKPKARSPERKPTESLFMRFLHAKRAQCYTPSLL